MQLFISNEKSSSVERGELRVGRERPSCVLLYQWKIKMQSPFRMLVLCSHDKLSIISIIGKPRIATSNYWEMAEHAFLTDFIKLQINPYQTGHCFSARYEVHNLERVNVFFSSY
jgi:hypothetical protein